MRAAAVICVREDGAYLESCLRHLLENGVDFAILDNGMDEAARALLERPPFRDGLLAVEPVPYDGAFALEDQLRAKERLFERLDADWLIHLDVDEAMHAYAEDERLVDSLTRIDAAGFNAINFDEFVFLPVDRPYTPGAAPQPLCAYYHFRPKDGPRLMRARKKSAGLTMVRPDGSDAAGGHWLFGKRLRLAPERFALRHYIFLDQAHARRKYVDRSFSEAEVARGWHGNRIGHPPDAYTFPSLELLKRLPDPTSRDFDTSEPKRLHYWQWPARG